MMCRVITLLERTYSLWQRTQPAEEDNLFSMTEKEKQPVVVTILCVDWTPAAIAAVYAEPKHSSVKLDR